MINPNVQMQPQIILLKDGTDTSQGRGQLISNINACQAVAEAVRTTLGPRGMDKLIHTGQRVTISNDGAEIMGLLDIVHPAAKVLVDIARAQDAEIGDGTTTCVLLAGELLLEAKRFIEEGVHSQVIIKGYRLAVEHALDVIRELALGIEDAAAYKSDGAAPAAPAESAAAPAAVAAPAPEAASGAGSSSLVPAARRSTGARRALMEKCAKTALNSKLISRYQDFFAPMIVDAIECLGEGLDLSMVGIKKVSGGSVTDSFLVDGVAFRRTFSYAGFEQQPKRFSEPKILLLNLELELKSERENAEVRIEDPTKYQSIVDAEWEIIYDKLRKCVESGADVILSKQPIGDLATQYFADRDVFCAGRVPQGDMQRIAKATGARVQTTVRELAADSWVLGKCEVFEERQVGAERYNIFRGCPAAMTATMVLRGGAEQFIAESARSVHDALMITKNCVRSAKIVGGGGAIEMEVSRRLREMALSIEGKLQLVVLAFARALEVIPRQISGNAGFDATDILNQLRHSHAGHAGPLPGVAAATGGSGGKFSAAPALVEAAAAGRMAAMPTAAQSSEGAGASESKEAEGSDEGAAAGGGGSGGKPSSMVWAGVDINLEGVCDTVASGVWEPSASKVSSFQAACEAACLVLSIDETVRNPRSEGAPQMGGPGMGGGAGIGRGKPMSAAMGGAGMRGMMGGGGGRGIRAFQGKGGKQLRRYGSRRFSSFKYLDWEEDFSEKVHP